MKLVSAMVVILTLAGCASSSQQSSQQYAQASQTDEQKCRTGTLKPGTAEYDKCRAIFDAARKQPSSY
jgi:outer membrane lipoprotein SlyB